jgi:HprK-related kinase A
LKNRVSDIPVPELIKLLATSGLVLDICHVVVRINSPIPKFVTDFRQIYGDFYVLPDNAFADFHIKIVEERSFFQKNGNAHFFLDGMKMFTPLPVWQCFVMFEWGLNWCLAAHSHQYLIIHAAVIEQDGHAAIIPAPPGSGKSTLCAGLVNRGWRLLSDELALYDKASGLVYGMARPINLKNESIRIIQEFAPEAEFTPTVPNTSKGTVALMRPPRESVLRISESARPKWIICPKYFENSAPVLEHHSKALTFMLLAEQSFNYDIYGEAGFEAVRDLIDSCRDTYHFTYSSLSDAETTFSGLLSEDAN